MTDQELITLALQGKESAFNQLYEKYDERLAHFVYARINNSKEAEDVIATIWEKIIIHLKDFKGEFEKSFQSWIFTVARNTITNHYKSSYHRSPPVDIATVTESCLVSSSPPHDFSWQETMMIFLKSLPQHQFEIIYLKYFKDLRNKEIAAQLKLSEKTVAAHLSRALKNLLKKCSNLDF